MASAEPSEPDRIAIFHVLRSRDVEFVVIVLNEIGVVVIAREARAENIVDVAAVVGRIADEADRQLVGVFLRQLGE